MYRFTRTDNEQARHFFEMAVWLDPTFACAHAGLSFTHRQNAFQHWADRERESDRAFEAAGRSLIVDDHDPAAHCLALAGRVDEGRAYAGAIREALPHYSIDDFLATFRFAPDAAALFREGAKRVGLG